MKPTSFGLKSVFVPSVLPFCRDGKGRRCRPRRAGSTGGKRCGSHWRGQTAAQLGHITGTASRGQQRGARGSCLEGCVQELQ